jgi:hypothetical protein
VPVGVLDRPARFRHDDPMEIEAAMGAVPAAAPGPEDTVRLARRKFDEHQRLVMIEARWAMRHPIYARMLYWPVCGDRLRARRRRYVDRVLAMI